MCTQFKSNFFILDSRITNKKIVLGTIFAMQKYETKASIISEIIKLYVNVCIEISVYTEKLKNSFFLHKNVLSKNIKLLFSVVLKYYPISYYNIYLKF